MRRAVVLGGGSPLGRRVTASLRGLDGFDAVIGIEPQPFDDPGMNDGLEFLAWAPDHRPFAEYLLKQGIDTVIDCGLVADRSGRSTRPTGADVISAMYVGAALSDERSSVRSWVLISSSAFHTSESYMPLLHRETLALRPAADDRSHSIAEAEAYARSVARRFPYLNVAILRLQELAGPDCRGPLADLLARPRVPRIPGFDPAIQFLHVEDAVRAVSWAATVELSGLYNVASEGILRWNAAIRSTGRPSLPILPISFPLVAGLLERLAIPVVHASLFDLLRYGLAVDIAKIVEAGWRPECDQGRCLADLG